jgi:hypothetical protein
MGQEKSDNEDEIQDILSDMDAILSGVDLSSTIEPAPAPAPVAAPPAPKPAPAPAPAPLPVAAPRATAPAAGARPSSTLKAPDPIPEVPVPEKLAKDQIRRVAFIYIERYTQERDAFAKALDNAANTIAKKPLFLRTVLFQAVSQEDSPAEVLARIKEVRAVAALAILEGMSEAWVKEYGDILGASDVMFRLVAPSETQKRSVAVDIIVDMMLLGHEV